MIRWIAAVLLVLGAVQEPKARLNILFIAVDDLRPQMSCTGDPIAKTPNIDRLAARGTLFTRAYCQQAVCSPSRSSLMTGRRPDTTKVYDLETHFRTHIPDVVTLPQHFKAHGYEAQGLSKIYHGGFDDAKSWSVPHWQPKKPGYGPEGLALQKKLNEEAKKEGKDLTKRQNQPRGLAFEAPEVADDDLADGATADEAVRRLGELKDKPFFLAVGFLKPHLPFVAPKRYWDLYDPAAFKLASNPEAPADAPKYAATNFGELRVYHGMPKEGAIPEPLQRKLVHGYYACMSFLDAQVGKVLDALDRLGLREKTVVALWGDHGWQLGEHGFWCKHTNYEIAVRAPLIVSMPGQKAVGKKSAALVEFVDLYPTLVEACGLPAADGVEGASFRPLLDDPARPWKKAAFSQYPRSIPGQGRSMGVSMRTDRWRLVSWAVPGKGFREFELYDHEKDPAENVNLAKRPEHAETVKELAAILDAGWRAALPPAR